MTRTIRTLQTTARSICVEIGRALGTLAGTTWFSVNALMAGTRLSGVEPTDAGLPEESAWLFVFAVAAGATIWLEQRGYERIRADTTGGGAFGLLSVFYLPFAFLPAGYALAVSVGWPPAFVNMYLLGCVLVAGWLAFYGGLDRLGLEVTHFGRAFVTVLGLMVAAVVVDALFVSTLIETVVDRTWITERATRATLALAGQGITLLLGYKV
ncbi:hypothetical protein [Halopiger djelfimassiliensis]|uniref:hypothetical protein n=1 Tax=Halopiger djelfimassiliensis TaxID=1293047 RepID=UPI000677E10E|nr:hypothetical protein [Halopiger djelfimassiliensis]